MPILMHNFHSCAVRHQTRLMCAHQPMKWMFQRSSVSNVWTHMCLARPTHAILIRAGWTGAHYSECGRECAKQMIAFPFILIGKRFRTIGGILYLMIRMRLCRHNLFSGSLYDTKTCIHLVVHRLSGAWTHV